MSKWTPPAGTKIVMPSILITSPEFVPTRGADVQATWRKRAGLPPTGAEGEDSVAWVELIKGVEARIAKAGAK